MSVTASDYYDQVVYIESLRYRAHWLDSYRNGEAKFTEYPQSNVINAVWAKWILRKGPNSTILLESVRYPNNYLDAQSGTCRVTYSTYPYDDDWALWYLEDIGNGNVSFRSKRYPDSRLDAHGSGEARVTKGSGDWSTFKIYQPTVEERKVLIFTYDNSKGTTPVQTEYTEEVGISMTESTSVSVTAEISLEIQKAFVSAKVSLSSTWSSSSSTTWNQSITKKVSVEVAPNTIKKIYQLTGFYGEDANQFQVKSSHLYFEG